MKTKVLVLLAVITIMGSVFVGCQKAEEDMTTSTSQKTSTTKPSDTKVSQGVSSAISEVSSDVSKGVTKASEKVSEAVTDASEAME